MNRIASSYYIFINVDDLKNCAVPRGLVNYQTFSHVSYWDSYNNVDAICRAQLFTCVRSMMLITIGIAPLHMEPGGSIPQSQGLPNNHYPEPNESTFTH